MYTTFSLLMRNLKHSVQLFFPISTFFKFYHTFIRFYRRCVFRSLYWKTNIKQVLLANTDIALVLNKSLATKWKLFEKNLLRFKVLYFHPTHTHTHTHPSSSSSNTYDTKQKQQLWSESKYVRSSVRASIPSGPPKNQPTPGKSSFGQGKLNSPARVENFSSWFFVQTTHTHTHPLGSPTRLARTFILQSFPQISFQGEFWSSDGGRSDPGCWKKTVSFQFSIFGVQLSNSRPCPGKTGGGWVKGGKFSVFNTKPTPPPDGVWGIPGVEERPVELTQQC